MNSSQAQEEIRFIREMIETSKRASAESGTGIYLIVWGVLAIVAVTGMFILVYFERYGWIWANWVLFMGIGSVLTIVHSTRSKSRTRIKTYAHTALEHLWFACGIAFILFGFVFPLLDLYSFGLIPVFVCVVAGVGTFVSGGIYKWSLLKWCGLIWWAGAVTMVFFHPHYRSLLFIPLIIVGYLVPGFTINLKYLRKEVRNES